jgi:phage tail sheath protein FI
MPFQVSAGVNVSEIDLTTVIPTVSTTEGAFVGHFRWGPVQKRILVDSENTLVAQFGTPNSNSASDFFTASSFLDYGNKLYVVRVVADANTTTQRTTSTTIARNAIANAANTKNTIIRNNDEYESSFINGITGVGAWVAKYPGDLGNSLRVSVCPSANAWQSTLTGSVIFTANSASVTGLGTSFTTQLTVGDILLAGPDRIEVKVASIGSANTLTLQTRYSGNSLSQVSVSRRWEFFNFFDDAPSSSDAARRTSSSNDEMHVVIVDEDARFSGSSNNVLERFPKVSKAADAKSENGTNNYYKQVLNDESQYIWWAAAPAGITHIGKNLTQSLDFNAGSQARPINASLTNGRDGTLPREADYSFGLDKFVSSEDVDISLLFLGDTTQTRATYAINNVAEKRKDCIVVFGPRRSDVVNNANYVGKEVNDLIAFRNLLPSTSYAVMDSGYKYMYDKYNDIYRYVPTNGDTAGLMVRTDTEFDPWYSPAGFNRGQIKNVVKLAYNPNKAARDQLYKSGINPVVSFPGQGTVLFGDKTLLARPSAFDRINVRRLFIVLQKAISTAAKFSLFEFNDEFTRAQFRNIVEPFLRDVQGRRGIYDFRVVCDETNNTPEAIDRNEFNGDIYIKPARTINFIQLNFIATRTGISFSEIAGA